MPRRLAAVLVLTCALTASAQDRQKWRAMDYGPFLTHTVQVSPGNIAQKGISIRLDEGPGGVSRGEVFAVFDTDTLRWAGGWTGGFIDWRGIVFDGRHGVHPAISGDLRFENPVGPGWGRPSDGSFEDVRVVGLDGKRYGPLPREWGHWKGLHKHGDRVVLEYAIGDTRVRESVRLVKHGETVAFQRTLDLGPAKGPLVLQAARAEGATSVNGAVATVEIPRAAPTGPTLDMSRDFTIAAWVKTDTATGTIIAKAAPDGPWVPKGKTFFVRGGKLGYDVGWVGVVQSKRDIADGKWHHVAVTHRGRDGEVRLWIDGDGDGRGNLRSPDGEDHVLRLGYTATTFMPPFKGAIDDMYLFDRVLPRRAVRRLANRNQVPDGLVAHWPLDRSGQADALADTTGDWTMTPSATTWTEGRRGQALAFDGGGRAAVARRQPKRDGPAPTIVVAALADGIEGARWTPEDGALRLTIPSSAEPRRLRITTWRGPADDIDGTRDAIGSVAPDDLGSLIGGGPAQWSSTLTTAIKRGSDDAALAVDELILPTDNPWKSWIRLGGFDFFADGNRAAVCSWQGDVWTVAGLADPNGRLTWRRVASGLFQPLGLVIRDEEILVLGRDQITILRDTNGDGEADHYENFNNDAQVTEHFHEFAMDLQRADDGSFYYMKGARHAKTAVVPHHGTLLRVAADGSETEIVARGFRAPNGLALSPDGTFLTSDQEGHWTPMNRINHVRSGGFYGNMMAYAPDREDESHDPPICWVHKGTDRSPSAQIWVTGDGWDPLRGAMLSLSYGTGRIWNVLHETVDGVMQGGLVRLPIPELATGIHRARFHPGDGHLYACGLFGWSSNKTRPGGFYRIRRTEKPLDIPVGLSATRDGILLTFSNPLDAKTAGDPRRYRLTRWNYKRSSRYGSDDWRPSDGSRGRDVVRAHGALVSRDGRSVFLQVADMRPVMQMRIEYNVRAASGARIAQTIDHTIHALAPTERVQGSFDDDVRGGGPTAAAPPTAPGLVLRVTPAGGGPVDSRPSRLAALRVPRDAPATPFVPAGPFRAVFQGYLDVPITGDYAFAAEFSGRLTVQIDGDTVLEGRHQDVARLTGAPLELVAGLNTVRVELDSSACDGDAVLRLLWSQRGRFDWEPVPPGALGHDASNADPAHADRRLGRELFARRGCVRCHETGLGDLGGGPPELTHEGPALRETAAFVRDAWLVQRILDPTASAPHATMPRTLDPARPRDRDVARDITAYLHSITTERPPAAASGEATAGAELWDDLGCASCHVFGRRDAHDRIRLDHVDAKYRPGALALFLADPQARHASIRMPDFDLTAEESEDLEAHLRARSTGTPDDAASTGDAARGMMAFFNLGCGACHTTTDAVGRRTRGAPALTFGSSKGGCLDPSPPDRAPRFPFDATERRALSAFLATDGASLRVTCDAEYADRAMDRMRCSSCHDRDGESAPRLEILAAEANRDLLPEKLPSLTWSGEKLRDDWVERLLEGSLEKTSRPWLRARMPSFAVSPRTLAAGLAGQHGVTRSAPPPTPDDDLAATGRLLATAQGFNCLQCHGVGAEPAAAAFDSRGVNFSRVRERLRHDFYLRWMHDPQRLEPGTKMPTFARGRRTDVRDVLGGDAGRQFDALWHWLQTSPRPARKLVQEWKVADLADALGALEEGRSHARGRQLFSDIGCERCHQVDAKKRSLGPNFSDLVKRHTPAEVLREILEPSARIAPGYESQVFFTKRRKVVAGIVRRETSTAVHVVEGAVNVDRPTILRKSRIASRRPSRLSIMPEGLVNTLTREEILDLMAYILSGGKR